MAKSPRTERRSDALSKDKIVEAAIAILDAEGEDALTFRALAARLSTGAGAIYWHVADKTELLTAATIREVNRVMNAGGGIMETSPDDAIRAIALRLFDLVDARPWVGAHLSREPLQPAMLEIFESIGGRLDALKVPESEQFNVVTALVNYILGCAAQNAANARRAPHDVDREAVFADVAAQWLKLDPVRYRFVRKMATRLVGHDDRHQFLAGVDLILAGIERRATS